MKLLGKPKLNTFKRKHTNARKQIDAWVAEVEDAAWQSPHEMRQRYPTADTPGNMNAIFNISGNKYRLWVRINYSAQLVIVKEVGTHEEYDKWQIK